MDKRKEKKSLKIFIHLAEEKDILQKKVEAHLMNNSVPCSEISDVIELFRQYLWTGQNIIPALTDYLSHPDLFKVPLKMLKLLRFLLVTIKLHIPSVQEGEENAELVLTEANINRVTHMICGKYIQECWENLLKLEHQNLGNGKMVCTSMMKWVYQLKERFEGTFLWTLLPKIQELAGGDMTCGCCICESELTYDAFNACCSNNHGFVLCCKTFLPCDEVPYRTCHVCKVQFKSEDKISGALINMDDLPSSGSASVEVKLDVMVTTKHDESRLHWLAGDKTRCNLCDGLLL